MEFFVTIVKSCKQLSVVTIRSMLDVAGVLFPPLTMVLKCTELLKQQRKWKKTKENEGDIVVCIKKCESQATFYEEVGRRSLVDALTNILNNFKDVVCQ